MVAHYSVIYLDSRIMDTVYCIMESSYEMVLIFGMWKRQTDLQMGKRTHGSLCYKFTMWPNNNFSLLYLLRRGVILFKLPL